MSRISMLAEKQGDSMNRYELLNKNKVLSSFGIIQTEFGSEKIVDINIEREMPFWINDIKDWLTNRSAAKHRRFVRNLLQEYNALDLEGFIALTNCLSLQDTLWVRKVDSDLQWENTNLFDNEFNDVITHLAFDGTGLYGEQITVTSPELTTDGNFDKCWIRRNNTILLLKAGSSGARNAGLEPYCETLASQLYDRLCRDSITYNIERYRNTVVSVCQSFSNKSVGYKPISLWITTRSVDVEDILAIIEENKCDVDQFRRMIIADSIMINSDRHFGNFGFCVDNDTYEVISLAPVFDLNLALSPYAEFDIDFPIYDEYIAQRGPVMGKSYVSIAKALLTPEIKSELINLKDLKLRLPEWCFEKTKYQFTKKRVEYLNEIKNVQIDNILGGTKQFSFLSKSNDDKLSNAINKMKG